MGTAVLLLVSARPASAQTPAPFRYEAGDDCPEGDAVLERIRQAQPSGWHEASSVELRIERSPSGLVEGMLRLGSEAPRSLRGETCGEVIDAVVEITGIWAARAAQAPGSPALHGAGGAESPLADGKPNLPPPTAPEARLDSGSDRRSHPPPAPERLRALPPAGGPDAESPSALWSLEFGAVGWLGTGPAPAMGALGRAGVTNASDSLGYARLGFVRVATETVEAFPAAVWSRLTVVTGGVCANVLRLSPVRLQACADAAGGVFEAGGIANSVITRPAQIQRAWVSVGPALRALVPLIGPHLGLSIEAAAPVPILHEHLVFMPPASQPLDVHQTWPVTPWLLVGLVASSGGSKSAYPGTAR